MPDFVPLEKQSKREQRAYNRKQRGTFEQMGCLNPVSRVIPDKKHVYKRSKFKREAREESNNGS